MSIYNEIKVTQMGIDAIINVTYGTELLPVELKVTDYKIPEGATAIAYSEGASKKVKKEICSIENNTIIFNPRTGFFEVGKNELQVRVVYDNKSLFSFKCKVDCHSSYRDDDAEEVESQPTLIEIILSALGLTDEAEVLPAVTEADNGKILQVVGGVWTPTFVEMTSDLPSEEGVKF